jgi:hypothetical protein
VAGSHIDLYSGAAGSAHERIAKVWPLLASAPLHHVQHFRVEAEQLRGRSALAVGDVELARVCAARLAREPAPWPRPMADLLRAGISARAGRLDPAAADLRRAVTGFECMDMALYAAAARHRLGAIIGGDEGRALRAAAEDWLRSETVVRPEVMIASLAPGFK